MFSSERENEPTQISNTVWHKRELREPTKQELLLAFETMPGKAHNALLHFSPEERLEIIKEIILSYDLVTKDIEEQKELV